MHVSVKWDKWLFVVGLVGRLTGSWLVGWLVGRPVGWLVGKPPSIVDWIIFSECLQVFVQTD